LQEAEKGAGRALCFRSTGMFGSANLAAVVAGSEIRYCRYLCPFNLCWVTGTRLDPWGFVFNCMVNRGLDRITPSMGRRDIAATFERAGRRPCRDSRGR
jgi:GTP 3',8-cyclase